MNNPAFLSALHIFTTCISSAVLKFSSSKVLEQVLNFKHMLKCFSLLNRYSWLPLRSLKRVINVWKFL